MTAPPSSSAPAEPAGRLSFDRLAGQADVQVVALGDFAVPDGAVRAPHRHDYHELIWVRSGRGEHRIDGEAVAVRPGSITVIGRGQVHQFAWAERVDGAVLRFTDAALAGGGAARIAAGWLLAGRGGRAITVPEGESDRVEALFAALGAEAVRPPDPYAADVIGHLIATVLLWLERWYDAARTERHDADDAAVQLQRSFARLLEDDFAAHHDARHYADALAVPATALSRALVALTGRSTKELVMERVMLEAMRLLRFTDLTVGEVAFRVGFPDQLYFSRAFKRHAGAAPQAWRERVRGDGA
jgi:AraC family transcriptional regulator, transcriptional activator of pobA